MRILMVIPQAFYTTRGTPLSAYHRTKELVARGHKVDILTYSIGGEPPDLAARVYRSKGPHFRTSIEAGPSRVKIWFDFLLFINLIYRLLVKRYDLIYAHEEGAFLARLVGWAFRVPYIYDMHSSLPLQITDWKFSNSPWVIWFFRWVERLSIRGARAVVAISPSVAKVAREVAPRVPIVTIVNYFEIATTIEVGAASEVRRRLGIAADKKIVLYTGSFVALQALDLLVDAVPLVLRELPDTVFLLVGGREAEMAQLRAQAERLGVADSIVLELSRPQQEMPIYMAAADVLVSPRVQGINPPGKLLSYLASGRPVVATNTLVHHQLLNDKCAILTEANAEGLARGLIKALTDRQLVAATVDAATEFLARHGSKEARDAAYDNLFATVASPAARPPTKSRQILSTSYEFPPLGGGGAKVASGIARRLVKRGYSVDLVTMGFRGLPSQEMVAGARVTRVSGVRLRIDTCSAAEMIPYILLAPLRLIRRVRSRAYAINHCHFIFPDGIVAYIAKRLTGLPYVITAHGSDVPGYNPNRFRLLHRLLLPVWRQITADASIIMCPSATIERLIKASNPRTRTCIVPNAIEMDKFIPGIKDARRLLIVTRMFERKGVQYVIQALAGSDNYFDVHIVGDGPFLATVKKMAASIGVKAQFWGHLDNDSAQLKHLYETAAIFVFTSESENFPIVLLEAMTAGAAIITTRGTGCQEVVEDAALLVPVRDAEAICEALDRLRRSPELVARLAASARDRVMKQFGWDVVIDRHLQVYFTYGRNFEILPK